MMAAMLSFAFISCEKNSDSNDEAPVIGDDDDPSWARTCMLHYPGTLIKDGSP